MAVRSTAGAGRRDFTPAATRRRCIAMQPEAAAAKCLPPTTPFDSIGGAPAGTAS
jgi:hypothetical protein